MKDVLKEAGKRIVKDIREYASLIITILVFGIILIAVLHNFCPIVIVTGFPCPGCGMTRAAVSLVTLHPVKAFNYNPSIYLWVPFALYVAFNRYILGKKIKRFNLYLMLVATGTLLIYIYRMAFLFPTVTPMVYGSKNLISRIFPVYDDIVRTYITG